MFDMQNIGRTIASARKAHDMTQMELADKLNISFQAISNWERGISMPDISKLPEIANLLDLTIDELLGKSSPVIDDLLSSDDEPLQPAEIEPEDVLEAAPLLKPSQLQNVIEKNKANFDISQFTSFFPFLPQDFLNELAERKKGTNRVRLQIEMVSDNKAYVVVEDLGFGEFYASTNQVWEKEIL